VSHAGAEGLTFSSTTVNGDSLEIRSCGGYAVRIGSSSRLNVDPERAQIVGNGVQAIELAEQIYSSDHRLANFGIPYHVLGDLLVGQYVGHARLTIDSGTRLEFATGAGVRVGYLLYNNPCGGSVTAQGTSEAPIVLTARPGVTDWKGLYFDDVSDWSGASSVLEWCTISGAGGSWGSGIVSNLRCYATNQPTIRECAVMGGAGTGLHLSVSPITISRSLISGNLTDGIYTTGAVVTIGGDSTSCNQIEDNGGYALRLGDGSAVNAACNWWGSNDEPTIASRIFDHADDPNLGTATYAPWSGEACGEWPIPEPFHLLSPAGGSRVLTLLPTFDWGDATGGENMRYQLEVATSPSFQNPILISDLIASQYTLESPLTDGQTYFWRVRATNDQAFSRYSGETWTVLANIPPSVPDPIYPIDGDIGVQEWYLVWLESTDQGGSALTYRVQVDDDPGFNSPEIDADGIQAERIRDQAMAVRLGSLPGIENLNAQVFYFWRVQAYDFYPDGSGFSPETIRFWYLDRETHVSDPGVAPQATRLCSLVPNPASPFLRVSFDLAESEPVQIEVYDVAGRSVCSLLDQTRPIGHYEIAWNLLDRQGERVQAGVYWIRMRAGSYSGTKRAIVLR
jgi:hypothetical protein